MDAVEIMDADKNAAATTSTSAVLTRDLKMRKKTTVPRCGGRLSLEFERSSNQHVTFILGVVIDFSFPAICNLPSMLS